jgi:RNA polymerase sigma-70 factor (ECF subfamily)
MSDTSWAALRGRLLERYDDFVRRLSRRLGSSDLAREVIHETYLRFERLGELEPVRNLDGYIMATAVNIARNRVTIERRYLTGPETDALIGIADEAPSSARTVEARSEMGLLLRILSELPPRRRQIFEGSWVDGLSYAELATRHRVHVRTIQREIAEATTHVRRRWDENLRPSRRVSGLSLSSD